MAILGCGYAGAALGRALAADGFDCLGTTTTPRRVDDIRALGIRPVVIELDEAARLHEILLDRDLVFLTVAAGGERRDYREVYLAGAGRLLKAVEGTSVRRVIYTSSTAVYGQDDGTWVDEESPTEPLSENGRVLVETERCLLAGTQDGGICATVLRLSGIYGPGRGPHNRLAQLAGQERNDGDVYLNLIHVDDIVAAMRRLIDVDYHGILNLSDDSPTPRREFYDRILAVSGLPPIQWTPRAGPARGKRVRNNRIKSLLNLSLRHPMH